MFAGKLRTGGSVTVFTTYVNRENCALCHGISQRWFHESLSAFAAVGELARNEMAGRKRRDMWAGEGAFIRFAKNSLIIRLNQAVDTSCTVRPYARAFLMLIILQFLSKYRS
jgi:hypothetical protein